MLHSISVPEGTVLHHDHHYDYGKCRDLTVHEESNGGRPVFLSFGRETLDGAPMILGSLDGSAVAKYADQLIFSLDDRNLLTTTPELMAALNERGNTVLHVKVWSTTKIVVRVSNIGFRNMLGKPAVDYQNPDVVRVQTVVPLLRLVKLADTIALKRLRVPIGKVERIDARYVPVNAPPEKGNPGDFFMSFHVYPTVQGMGKIAKYTTFRGNFGYLGPKAAWLPTSYTPQVPLHHGATETPQEAPPPKFDKAPAAAAAAAPPPEFEGAPDPSKTVSDLDFKRMLDKLDSGSDASDLPLAAAVAAAAAASAPAPLPAAGAPPRVWLGQSDSDSDEDFSKPPPPKKTKNI